MIFFLKKGCTTNAFDGTENDMCGEKKTTNITNSKSENGLRRDRLWMWRNLRNTLASLFCYFLNTCTRMKECDNQCVSLKVLWVGKTKTF